MPFDTVGGLPPMPTHARGTTLYHPRQPEMLMATHSAPFREKAAASFAFRSPFPLLENVRDYSENSKESDGALPPLLRVTLPPETLVPSGCIDALPPNPWRQRTTVDELERAQRKNPRGVAQFRPVVQATAETYDSLQNEAKPLLEPYRYAQALAQAATADPWDLRFRRKYGWQRKAVATPREGRLVDDGPKCQSSCIGSVDNHSSTNRHRLNEADKSGIGSPGARRSSTMLTPPSHVQPFLPVESPETRKECTVSCTEVSEPAWQVMGTANEASPLFSGANPNELAVRCLFQAARMEAAASGAGNAHTALSSQEPAGVISSVSTHRTSESGPWQPPASFTHETAGIPFSGSAHVTIDTSEKAESPVGTAGTLPLGPLSNLLIDGATLALFGLENTESDEEKPVSTSNSTMAPPSEYDLDHILHDRMHQRVATFTPSSRHTLDEPPRTAKAHAILGTPRLATNTSTQALLINAGELERHSQPAAGCVTWTAQPASATSQNSVRAMRRLFYDEEYERGLLLQLAQQSSPTRWYSKLLPNGKDGIRFRLLLPPHMTDDKTLHERLYGAIRQATQAIAQPRRDAAAVEEAHRHAPLWVLDNRKVNQFSATEDKSITLERASAEKTLLFKKWSRLHENVSAQLLLFREEAEQRRRLLGEFFSCKHPFPCICLTCDLEVLDMSALELEPTVKPACWYASVVLGRHKDVLQKELLALYLAERHHLYGFFKVEFSALYAYKKLESEESRRFRKMVQYHEFCLRVAASGKHEQQQPQNEGLPPVDAVTSRPVPSDATALMPEQAAVPEDVEKSAAAPPMCAHLLRRGDSRMWRLRQHRLRSCAAFDSPFFSYLLYTQVLAAVAAEDHVRAKLMLSETAERAKLEASMMAEESFARLSESERRGRVQISVDCEDGYSALRTGPFIELQAAHAAELQTAQVLAYAKTCEESRKNFVAAAVAEKVAAEVEEMNRYRQFMFEMRQRSLALLVARRSVAESKAASGEWLRCQQHRSLFNSEQRLRDRIALVEERDEQARIVAAAEESLRQARRDEASRLSEEAAAMREAAQREAEAVQRARDLKEAAIRAQLQREERAMYPSKRPSASMRPDTVSSFFRLATELDEDFDVFLPSLSNDS
ncbi:hypothetical protein, conserved [Leishmania tarentolae]|uniref:Uncharacterized protein n=1 Tax=Leishmania tarentolae TaxID=5689 RepID=A0A640KL41_LEITA|nr:hypothetical protein, conserved [Leishmania tarentolae]